MIKAKVVSFTLSESIDSISKLDLETYLEDRVDINSFYGATPWEGLDVVIMTEEEYKVMDSVSDGLRQSLLDEREKTKELRGENEAIQKAIKNLEKRIEQGAAEIDIHPNGAIVFKHNVVSKLEKEVEKLKEENKDLKARLLARWKVKLDAAGMLIYPESKED